VAVASASGLSGEDGDTPGLDGEHAKAWSSSRRAAWAESVPRGNELGEMGMEEDDPERAVLGFGDPAVALPPSELSAAGERGGARARAWLRL
jgi:hypothetical protein